MHDRDRCHASGNRGKALEAAAGLSLSVTRTSHNLRYVNPHTRGPSAERAQLGEAAALQRRGYALSQRLRKRVEEIFGWMKAVGGFRRTRYRGLDRTGLAGYLVGTAYNLVRMARLMTAETPAPQAMQAA